MTQPDPAILHINAINFQAAVTTMLQPDLSGSRFVIGDQNMARGLVLGVSAAAWSSGLRNGTPLSQMRSRKDLRIIAPAMSACAAIQESMQAVCLRYTPQVESSGGGHLYLDLKGSSLLFGPIVECALQIREDIWQELGLTVAIALATNKLLAKIGTRVVGPGGFIQINAGNEAEFLGKQAISLLNLTDYRLTRQLASLDFHDIGDLARLSGDEIRLLFGPWGAQLHELARGIDHSVIVSDPVHERRIDDAHQFPDDTNDPNIINGALLRLVAETGYRMRAQGWSTQRIGMRIAYSDGFQSEGYESPACPLRFDGELSSLSRKLLERLNHRRVRVRCLSLSLERLGHEGSQVELFPQIQDRRHEGLQRSIDRNRTRFGQGTLLPLSALAIPKA